MAHAVSSNLVSSNALPPFILGMPNDVTVLFFEWLRLPDVEVSRLVCSSWNAILGLESVWQRLLEWHYSKHTITLQEGETHQSAYRKLHRLIPNLNHFVCSPSKLCVDMGWGMDMVDEKLILCSIAGNIEIYDSNSFKRERRFRLLRLPEGEQINSFTAEAGKVFFRNYHRRQLLVSDSCPFLVKGEKVQLEIKDLDFRFLSAIRAIAGDKIYSSHNRKITIHPLQSNQQDVVLKCSGVVHSILVADKKLYAGSGKTIEIWDLSNNTNIGALEGHSNTIVAMAHRENYLFSVTFDGELKMWDFDSRKCIATHIFPSANFKLAFSGKRLLVQRLNEILILDFTADHNTVLKEIADLLEKNDPFSIRIALERLSRLPEYTQKKIEAAFKKIAQNNFSVEIFEVSPSLYALNPFPLAQAIRNVLAAPKSLEHPREREKRERESMNNQNNPPNKGE